MALVLVAAFHRPLLRSVAAYLLVEKSVPKADFFVLLPSILERPTIAEETARRYSSGEMRGILLFEPPVSRGVACGAWTDPAISLRADLVKRGVPESAIVLLPNICRTTWDAASAVGDWLDDRRPTRLVIVGPEFRGRSNRLIFDSVLQKQQATRIEFAAVSDGIDQDNWWQSREGIQLVFQNYATLAFDWCGGKPKACKPAWTLAEFEKSLPAPAGD